MANRTTHLTHLHIVSLTNFDRDATQRSNLTEDEAIHALHGVAKCLNAFPDWAEVTASSHKGVRSIGFVRRQTGRELSQYHPAVGRHDASEWLGEFEGYGIETKGWIHGNRGFGWCGYTGTY